jgi:hypothetical protein
MMTHTFLTLKGDRNSSSIWVNIKILISFDRTYMCKAKATVRTKNEKLMFYPR